MDGRLAMHHLPLVPDPGDLTAAWFIRNALPAMLYPQCMFGKVVPSKRSPQSTPNKALTSKHSPQTTPRKPLTSKRSPQSTHHGARSAIAHFMSQRSAQVDLRIYSFAGEQGALLKISGGCLPNGGLPSVWSIQTVIFGHIAAQCVEMRTVSRQKTLHE